jgi:hypothetical protein
VSGDKFKGVMDHVRIAHRGSFSFRRAVHSNFVFSQHRFSFTMLDPRDPHKNFSFELEATNDVWSVQECDLDGDTVNSLVGHLNETDDMLAFVRGMRRAFLKQIAARNKGSPRTGRPMVL